MSTNVTVFLASTNMDAVTAVRLDDGWHEGVTGFYFYGDGESPLITKAGAIWQENGCTFSCPLPSILALRQGTSAVNEPSRHLNQKLQKALEWLAEKLQDGYPRPAKTLSSKPNRAGCGNWNQPETTKKCKTICL